MPELGNREYKSIEILTENELKAAELFAAEVPVEKIACLIGVSGAEVRNLLHSATVILSANDDLVDDYIVLLDKWEAATGQKLFEPKPAPEGGFDLQDKEAEKMWMAVPRDDLVEAELELLDQKADSSSKQAILSRVQGDFSPRGMRDLAGSLLRLADSLDQGWSPEGLKKVFSWPSSAARIEKKSISLAKTAVLLLEQREVRKQFLPDDIFGDPAWSMLLELFVQFSGGAKISSKSLSLSADCPPTTALRHIDRLEEAGLVSRTASKHDGRVTLVELTKDGVVGVGRFLERVS